MNVMLAFAGYYFVYGAGHTLYMCDIVAKACQLVH